jgi:hypothetical protein
VASGRERRSHRNDEATAFNRDRGRNVRVSIAGVRAT